MGMSDAPMVPNDNEIACGISFLILSGAFTLLEVFLDHIMFEFSIIQFALSKQFRYVDHSFPFKVLFP